jgi:hypothetical protein
MDIDILKTQLELRGAPFSLFVQRFKEQNIGHTAIGSFIVECNDVPSAIAKAFDWAWTEEGWDFWHGVAFPHYYDPHFH